MNSTVGTIVRILLAVAAGTHILSKALHSLEGTPRTWLKGHAMRNDKKNFTSE